MRSTADEQIPFNVQGVSILCRQSSLLLTCVFQYLDEFSKALATEVRILLGEVGKLREERRGLQQYVSHPSSRTLLTFSAVRSDTCFAFDPSTDPEASSKVTGNLHPVNLGDHPSIRLHLLNPQQHRQTHHPLDQLGELFTHEGVVKRERKLPRLHHHHLKPTLALRHIHGHSGNVSSFGSLLET